eukprot:4761276-Lingulodinium_polyedra.AAC.1
MMCKEAMGRDAAQDAQVVLRRVNHWRVEGQSPVRGCGGAFCRVARRLRWRGKLRDWLQDTARAK